MWGFRLWAFLILGLPCFMPLDILPCYVFWMWEWGRLNVMLLAETVTLAGWNTDFLIEAPAENRLSKWQDHRMPWMFDVTLLNMSVFFPTPTSAAQGTNKFPFKSFHSRYHGQERSVAAFFPTAAGGQLLSCYLKQVASAYFAPPCWQLLRYKRT